MFGVMLCAILIPQVGAVIRGCSARLIIINQHLRLENLKCFWQGVYYPLFITQNLR